MNEFHGKQGNIVKKKKLENRIWLGPTLSIPITITILKKIFREKFSHNFIIYGCQVHAKIS